MPYRIRNGDTTRELYLQIIEAWLLNMPNMVDGFRDDSIADAYLEDPGTAWYRAPGGAFFWVSNISGGNGDFHALNPKGAKLLRKPKAYHPVLREIFHDLKLTRLSAFIPEPLRGIRKAAQLIGFKHEGTVRKIAKFNNEYHNAEILGMLYEDIPPKEKRKRQRPGRKRRKRPSRQKVNRVSKKVTKAA